MMISFCLNVEGKTHAGGATNGLDRVVVYESWSPLFRLAPRLFLEDSGLDQASHGAVQALIFEPDVHSRKRGVHRVSERGHRRRKLPPTLAASVTPNFVSR